MAIQRQNRHLLLFAALLLPLLLHAANGQFDSPQQAFSYEAKTPGLIHLKILVSHSDASRWLKEAYFYVQDSLGNKTRFLYAHETNSNNDSYVIGTYRNELAQTSTMFMTNGENGDPKWIIRGTDTQHQSHRADKGPAYMEIDWYWPTAFAGRKFTWGVEGKLYVDGSMVAYATEIGQIEFDQLTYETFDPIIGMQQGDDASVTVPFMCDKPMLWVEGSYTDQYGRRQTLRQSLPEGSYSGFLRLPATDVHRDLSVTAGVVTATWTDAHNGDPTRQTGTMTKRLGDVAMLHAPITFCATPLDDGTGAVRLTWSIDNTTQPDIIPGDAFQIQRSLTGKEDDFEDLHIETFDLTQTDYTYTDATLLRSLQADHIDAELSIPIVRYRIRRMASANWGWTQNPTTAYGQPNFKSLHLLQPTNLKSEWDKRDEFTVRLEWDYKPSTEQVAYVWDERAEMSARVIIYNRQSQVLDTVCRVLSDDERQKRQLTLNLTRPCAYYAFQLLVDGKESPIAAPTGKLYVKIRTSEDLKAFADSVNAGHTNLNAILLEAVKTDNVVIGDSPDHPYRGVFEGAGHLLMGDLTNDRQYQAPFRYTDHGVRLRNVFFRISIDTGQQSASNAIGCHLSGLAMMEHCYTDGEIISRGSSAHGSFVGKVCSGSTMLIDKCHSALKFKGDIINSCAGFVGYKADSAICRITNSFMRKNASTGEHDCYTFIRAASTSDMRTVPVIGNCYYDTPFGQPQGMDMVEAGFPYTYQLIEALAGAGVYSASSFSSALSSTTLLDSSHLQPNRHQHNYTVTDSSGPRFAFPADNLFDGDINTDWYTTTDDTPDSVFYVEFQSNDTFVPVCIALTPFSFSRYPTSWTLKGKLSSDDEWQLLHQVTRDSSVWTQKVPQLFLLQQPQQCRYYRFEVDATKDNCLDLAELNLLPLTDLSYFHFDATGTILPTLNWTSLQQSVLLQWETDEKPIDYFEVQRRTEDSPDDWQTIATNISRMQYEDRTTSPVYTYYYRVRAVNDCEGITYTYTDSVRAHCVQTGTVEGYVRFADGTGIPDVQVTVSPSADHADSVAARTVKTDSTGHYRVEDLLYYSQQSGPYDVSVNIAATDLAPDCADGQHVTFDAKSNHSSDVSFTVTKGYRFSGYVMYDGTSIPVPAVSFTVNGRTVSSHGTPVTTDHTGRFSFYLLGGQTQIQAHKEGHKFADKGIYIHNFTTDKDQAFFYDQTKATLIGRVVGGQDQGSLPLANSLSRNNLGDSITIVIALEGDNSSWLVYDNLDPNLTQRDQVYTHIAHDKKYNYQTRTHTTRHSMKIWPDKHTGEYKVELPPVKWKIQQIFAEGYSTLFQSGKTGEVIDLTDSIHLHSDTLSGRWQSLAGNDVQQAVVEYHAQYSRIYHTPVQLDYRQVGYDKFDYMGDRQYVAKNLGGDKTPVTLAYQDSVTGLARYTFGHPVFSLEKQYLFQLSAHEKYYWNNNLRSDTVDVVQMKGGQVTIHNGMLGSNAPRQELTLDSVGRATTFLEAAQTPYTLTGSMALSTVSMTLLLDGTYYEAEPLKAYVLNVKPKAGAKDLLSYSTPRLIDILRDPPGGSSSAKISKGSTLKYAYQMDMSWKAGVSIGLSAGNKLSTFTGVVAAPMGAGAVGGFNNDATNKFNLSLDLIWSGSGQRAFAYTMTANQDIATSSNNLLVGADADLYIGMVENVVATPAIAIRALTDSAFLQMAGELKAGRMIEIATGRDQRDSLCHLVREEVVTCGTKVQSSFVHSQDYIVSQLIPELAEQCRAKMFVGTEAEAKARANQTKAPVYLSKVGVESDRFGVDYTMIRSDGSDGTEEDEVEHLHNSMLAWVGMVAQNEKEKLAATERVQNFDVDGGGGTTYSEEFSSEYSITKSMSSPISAGTVGYFDSTHGDNALGALQVLGPIGAKLLGSLLGRQFGGTDGTATGTSQGNESEVAFTFAGWTVKVNLTPVVSFNVVPKNTEQKKYSRKESFTIGMDISSHLNFDVYRVKTDDDAVAATGVMDVFTHANFDGLVSGNEPFLKREIDLKDISYARSFVYRTLGGATCRPYEPGRVTLFYRPGTLLDEPTKKIENPKLWLDKQSVSGVPYGEPARFTLHMANESEQPEAAYQYFNLFQVETSNSKGARILIDGMPLTGNTRTISVPVGTVTTKAVEVYAGEDFDYDDLTLRLISLNDKDTYADAKFSVHYLRTAGKVEIASPGDKWIMNTDAQTDSRGYFMPVVISGFDKNQKNFDHIEFQYKEATRGDDYWTCLCSFYAKDSLMALATGTKAMIPENGNIITSFYGEGVEMEKAYDLRAVLFCRNAGEFLTSTSKVLSGIKDTRRPQLFDTPEPRNGILSAGDNVVFNFSEAIEHNYLSSITNFEVVGETNETSLQEEPSLRFDGRGFAQTEARRNCKGKNVTIDMMIMPDDTDTDMPIFCHGSDGVNLELWVTADKRLRAVVGDTTLTSDQRLTGSGFKHIALVVNNELQQVEMYNDSLIGRFTDVSYGGFGPYVFGATNETDVAKRKHYSGRMLETRIWNRAMTQGQLYQTYAGRQLTGYEMGLIDYYPMNEGRGYQLNDKAHGAHATMTNASWAQPAGMSLKLDWNERKAVKGLQLKSQYFSRPQEADYTLMFWFKTDADGRGALISNGSGRASDLHARDNYFIGFEGAQLRYRTNGMQIDIPGSYSDDQWHHYAMTVNRARNVGNIYLDCELRASFRTDTLGGMDGSDVYIGNMVWYEQGPTGADVMHQANPLSGHIDELCLFQQALPPALIKRYSTKSLGGKEKGLITYMGFNRRERNKQNDIQLVPYALNQTMTKNTDGSYADRRDSVFVAPTDTILAHIDRSVGAPVQQYEELRNLNFSFVGRDNQLLVNINEPDERINKNTLYVTVADIPDMNGNYMASPATVSMFVDCNPIRWQTRSLSEYAAEGMASEFYAKVVNTSGATHTYELRGMPEWLRADKPVGMIDPEGEVEIMFTIDKGLNVGMYDEVIYVVDENNLYEPLLLAVEVEGEEPQWFVWPSQKQYSMNIVGSVSINDVVITDPKDLVGVFDQTGRCMGVSNVSYDPQTAQSMLYLTVYDSTAVESQLYFKLWHHQTGKTLLLTTTPDTITFAPGQVRGTVKDPIAMKAGDSYIQKLQLDSGWNWISLNVYNNDFRNIDKLLKGFPWQNGDILTDDSDGLTLIYKNGSWLTNREGSLGKVSIKPSLSYRIKVQNDITIEIAGNSLKQKNMRRITVKPGWNGIGYTPMVNLDIETALADYYSYAQDGDVIKSQDEFAMFTKGAYDKGEWSGSLKYLHPGDGYMLKRMGTDTVQFYYPYHEPGYTFAAADMRAPRHTPSHAHAATMNVAAAIEGISLCQGDSLIALADGQVCGQAACTDDVVYLSIGGDKKAPLRFAILRDGQLMAVTSEQLMFQPDHVSGSPSEPTVIRFLRNADTTPSEGWHTLQGLRLPDKPARQGVYIHNGKTVIHR